MSINCSPTSLKLFNVHRELLAKNNGHTKNLLSHEETISYLLSNSPIIKQAEEYMKSSEELKENTMKKLIPQVKK